MRRCGARPGRTSAALPDGPSPPRLRRGCLCVPSMGDDLEVKVLWNN